MERFLIEADLQVSERLGDSDRAAELRLRLAAMDAPSEIQSLIDASIPVAEGSDHG